VVRLAERAIESDYRSMNKIARLLVATALLTCGSVYGRIPDNIVGTWRATTTLKTWQGTETLPQQIVVSKLRGGAINLNATVKVKGKRVLVSKVLLNPDGRLVYEIYAGRSTPVQTGKGTWRRVSSNVLSGTSVAKTRYGDITDSFKVTRSNRNRWVRTATTKQGKVTATSRTVAVRIR
jgi:hypothetical protein